jgi:hypothetical protein
MSKKEIVFIVFGVLILIGLIGIVSAESQMAGDFQQMLDELIGMLKVFFTAILGQEIANSSMFFQTCLILIVVYGIIYSVLSRIGLFSGNGFLLFFTSAAVSILGIRFIDASFIASILVPYGALGASIAIFLPYLIYFFFVHTSVKGTFGRRAAWILFGIVLMGIYFSKYISYFNNSGVSAGEAGYNSMSILGLIFVFLAGLFDPQIHGYFKSVETGKAMSKMSSNAYVKKMHQLSELDETYNRGALDYSMYHNKRREILADLKRIQGQT